jgi:methionyl-tRNA formyltransferase
MKIVFFGTPDFAVPSLKRMLESSHEVAAVVTAPDKERGRGRKVSFTPVKEFAIENALPVLQPENLKNGNFIAELKKINADVFVVVAFRILPSAVYTLPKYAFNLHGSLLPKYRGAAPIQWALINGEKETGVTTFLLEKTVDTGNIILQKKIEISPDDDFGTLHDKLSLLGADAVLETVEILNDGNFEPLPQDDTAATKAPKITKDLARINWHDDAEKIVNLVRGLSPFPAAFFESEGKIYKVYKARVADVELSPGEVGRTKKELFVGAGKGAVEILEIRPEGRKRMTAEEFLRGYEIASALL